MRQQLYYSTRHIMCDSHPWLPVQAKKLLGLSLQQENGARYNGPYALKAWLQDHPDHNQDQDAASSDEGGSSHGSHGQQQQPELIPDVTAEDAFQLGFVRGVLLPVRNALGNAARVGALLEDGPGPYTRDTSRTGLQVRTLTPQTLLHRLNTLVSHVSCNSHNIQGLIIL